MKKKPIRTYRDVIDGQEVTVTVYTPATEEDMQAHHVDSELEEYLTEDKYQPARDMYDTLADDKELWRLLFEEAEDEDED